MENSGAATFRAFNSGLGLGFQFMPLQFQSSYLFYDAKENKLDRRHDYNGIC
jgi:hypothetical protein